MFKGILCRNKVGKDKAIKLVKSTVKPIKYWYGYAYRKENVVSITKEDALKVITDNKYLDIREFDDHIIINAC